MPRMRPGHRSRASYRSDGRFELADGTMHFQDEGHVYHDGRGLVIPNVTAITRMEASPNLVKWEIEQALASGDPEAGQKEKEAAGDRGNLVHDAIEGYIRYQIQGLTPGQARRLAQPLLVNDDVRSRFRHFTRWERKYKPTYLYAEIPIWNRGDDTGSSDGWVLLPPGYAGRVDIVAIIDGVLFVLDIKAGNTVAGREGVYNKITRQLEAYRRGVSSHTDDETPEHVGVIHLPMSGGYRFYASNRKSWKSTKERDWIGFLACYTLYQQRQG